MSKFKQLLYLSFDIETDGDNPMLNSMISIGFCGMKENKEVVFEYCANIEELEGHKQNQKTMEFWQSCPVAYANTQTNRRHYTVVMRELSQEFERLSQSYKLIFCAMPACFDWMFFKSYYELARDVTQECFFDIGYQCVCISSYFNAHCINHEIIGKKKEELKHHLMQIDSSVEHFAYEDAKCQARLLVALIYE